MKKTLIALAAVAVSSAAMAQVTMSGYINYQYGKTGAAASSMGVNDAGLTFSAAEDLGNGVKVAGSFNIDTMHNRGGAPANGDSAMSLSAPFGTVSMARTRSSHMGSKANVFGASIATGFNDGIVFTRSEIQAIGFTTAELVPGLRVSASSSAVSTAQGQKTVTVGATYTAGPLSLGIQQKSANTSAVAAAVAAGATGFEAKATEGFATFNAGVAVVGLGYGSKQTATGDAVVSYGVSVPMGAFTLGVDGATRGDAEFMNYGVRYAFSPRTALHVSAGKYQTTATNSANQTRVRLAHSF